MAHNRGGHTQPISGAIEYLAEELRISKAKVQALEAQVQKLKAEVRILRRPSVPLSFTINFETPEYYQRTNSQSDGKSKELSHLLNLVPETDEDWSKRRNDLQLSKPEAVIQIFLEFIDYTQYFRTITSDITAKSQDLTKIEAIRNYEAFLRKLRQDNIRATQISNFGSLLLVCLCRVAIQNGVSVDTIDELMNAFLPKRKASAKKASYLRHLRSAALWPIQQADILRGKFSHRADEFFLLYGPPIETYRALYEDKNNESFGTLATLPPPPKEGDVNGDVSFSVPFMVKLITGSMFSLREISSALGTDLKQTQFDASLYAILTKAQQLWVIHYPPTKRQKTSISTGKLIAGGTILTNTMMPASLNDQLESEAPHGTSRTGTGTIYNLDVALDFVRSNVRSGGYAHSKQIVTPLESPHTLLEGSSTIVPDVSLSETAATFDPRVSSLDHHDGAATTFSLDNQSQNLRNQTAETLVQLASDVPSIQFKPTACQSNDTSPLNDPPESPRNFNTAHFAPLELSDLINYSDEE